MKHSRLFYPLTFICSLVYFASYLTRLNYQVMIAAVAEAEQLAKSTVSLAVTALFISYGLGQLLAGVLGDKAEPETLILAGLGGSVVINFLMPLVPGVTARTALWGINGLFQAMIWPPAVRLLSANLDNKEYEKAAILLKRIGGNEPFCCAMLFVILTASALLLLTAGRRGPVFSAVLLMICSGISHAINYVLVCIAPNRFKGGRVAWIAGLFNFSVYVGSALSTFGFAKLAEGRGWFFTIGTWVVMAVIGAASCGFIAAKWQTRFMNRVK
jgi:sugar phosphate permease